MLLHAENDKQKKVISMHICTGVVCKKCLHYSKSVVFPGTGYCGFWNKSGITYNDFCSLFKEDVRLRDNSNKLK